MSKATKENSHINLSTTSLQEKEADKCGNHQNALNNKVIINKKKTNNSKANTQQSQGPDKIAKPISGKKQTTKQDKTRN